MLVTKLDAMIATLHEAKQLETEHASYSARKAELEKGLAAMQFTLKGHQASKIDRSAELEEIRACTAQAKAELAQVLQDLDRERKEHDRLVRVLADLRRKHGLEA
jgi:predicted  nucleic acid-binding Zn-ribbon protein